MKTPALVGLAGLTMLVPVAMGQVVTVDLRTPTLDRWMYQFGPNDGTEPTASTFGAIRIDGFDDRDAQFLIGFDLTALVTPGLPLEQYWVRGASVEAVLASTPRVIYDPSFDSVRSLYASNDPEYVVDPDGGRPTELFAVGFRSGFTAQTFQENSAFAVPLPPAPAEGIRTAFAAAVDEAGNATDISRQVRQRFDATPFAIGLNSTTTPGQLLAQGAPLNFEIGLCNPGARSYLRRALRDGRLLLMISSLEPAAGGPGGPTGPRTYPAFFTKENPITPSLDAAPKLRLVVKIGRLADFDGDGGVSIEDLLGYLAAYDAGTTDADVTDDCGVSIEDLLAYLDAYEIG